MSSIFDELANDQRLGDAYTRAVALFQTTDIVILAEVTGDEVSLSMFERAPWLEEFTAVTEGEGAAPREFVEKLARPATEGSVSPMAFWLIAHWAHGPLGICRIQCARLPVARGMAS